MRAAIKPITSKRRARLAVKHCHNRNGWWHFRIAVPKNIRENYGNKAHIAFSLETRDTDIAAERAIIWTRKYKEEFGAKAFDFRDTQHAEFQRRAAALLGYQYGGSLPDAKSGAEFFQQMAPAVEAVKRTEKPTEALVALAVGAIPVPSLTMNRALELYKEYSVGKFSGVKDERAQYKRWRPFVQAVDEWNRAGFANADVSTMPVKTVYEYKKYLHEKIDIEKKFDLATGRKKLMWLRLILAKVFEVEYSRADTPFDSVKLDGKAKKGQRPRFTEHEIVLVRKEISESDANEELKAIAVIMELTGTSCKELTLLAKGDIVLDAPIPYIRVDENEFRDQVKSGGSRHRITPLIGRALGAAKKFPNGFSRYQTINGAENLGECMNKIIQRVVPKKTTYCFRHRFAHRVRNANINADNLRDAIMGHTSKGMGMHYGDGFDLDNKLLALRNTFPEEFTD
jgi:integrase